LDVTILIEGRPESFAFEQHLEMVIRAFPSLGRTCGKPLLEKLFLARREQLFNLV
jgi:hypothetical protein